MINMKNLDPNEIKIDENSYKNICIHYIEYVATNSVKPLYLIINKINGYIEEINGNKYYDESKDTLKKQYKQVCRTMEQNQRFY